MCVYVAGIEIRCGDVEHLVLAPRAAAACGNAVLSFSHQGSQSVGTFIRSILLEEVKLCQLFCLFVHLNDCCPSRSQLYVQRFQIPEGHLQRQVQPPRDLS